MDGTIRKVAAAKKNLKRVTKTRRKDTTRDIRGDLAYKQVETA